jgi:hypothetical protein
MSRIILLKRSLTSGAAMILATVGLSAQASDVKMQAVNYRGREIAFRVRPDASHDELICLRPGNSRVADQALRTAMAGARSPVEPIEVQFPRSPRILIQVLATMNRVWLLLKENQFNATRRAMAHLVMVFRSSILSRLAPVRVGHQLMGKFAAGETAAGDPCTRRVARPGNQFRSI